MGDKITLGDIWGTGLAPTTTSSTLSDYRYSGPTVTGGTGPISYKPLFPDKTEDQVKIETLEKEVLELKEQLLEVVKVCEQLAKRV